MKRVALLIATNMAVMLVIGIVLSILGVGRVNGPGGLQLGSLLIVSLVVGFAGSFISLLMSKPMAKWSTGAKVITNPQSDAERWLVERVKVLADKAGIGMPEVAIYEGEPNAFATGAFKNSSLVAVSTGLLHSMSAEEVEAVLAHEVAHVANGDMITLTLIQGIMNTFVFFLSRVVGSLVDSFLRRGEDNNGPGIGYFVTSMVCQLLFGMLAGLIVAWFSRQREFRADAGAAKYMGTPGPMINALARLGGVSAGELPKGMAASGISGIFGSLGSTHPPIEARIAALKAISQ